MNKIVLPLPPPVNATYRAVNVKGRTYLYKSAKAKDWEEEAEWAVLPYRPEKPLKSQLCASVKMFLKRDRDTDGSQKLLFDLLEKMRFYENDKQIKKIIIEKFKDKENPRIEVIIDEYGATQNS